MNESFIFISAERIRTFVTTVLQTDFPRNESVKQEKSINLRIPQSLRLMQRTTHIVHYTTHSQIHEKENNPCKGYEGDFC